MFSYRFMNMNMGENKDGNTDLAPNDIISPDGLNYLVTPLEMQMDMHMVGLMYAPTSKLTLMAMTSYVELSMDHQIRDSLVAMNPNIDSNLFTTESSGIGDTTIGGIYELSERAGASWLLNFGVSLPTGDIDHEDIVPPVDANEVSQLPFPMQIGSGTFDLLPGVTFTQLREGTSWGAQVKGRIHLGENDNGYTRGDQYQAQIWHGWRKNEWLSLSTRLGFSTRDNYDGLDENQRLPVFNPNAGANGANTVSTVDPNLRGGSQADFGLGANLVVGERHHRVAGEISYTFWHDLDGPQLATDLSLTFGYQYVF